MRRTVMLLCLAVQACTFDSSVPDTLVIRCGPKGECPDGYLCNPDFDQCRRDQPGELPVLTATFSPSRLARPGSVVAITVRADRALQAAPRVRAQHRDGSVVLGGASSTEGFLETTFEFTVTPDIGEGQVVLFADAISSTGALLAGVRVGDLIVDETPPRLLDGATVSPARAQRDARVSVRVEFDEPVRDTVRLVAQLPSRPDEVLTPSSNRVGGATFLLTVPADAVDGVAALSLTGVSDEAGNDAVGPLTLPSLIIDSTPPQVGPLGLEGLRFSQVPGHDLVRFTVAFDEPVSDARWCIGNRCELLPASMQIAVSLGDAGIPEGPAPVVVTGRDEAGNVGTRTEFLTLDYSPPALASDPASVLTPRSDCPLRTVSALGVGGTHRLSFTVNEPLSQAPEVGMGPWAWQPSGPFDGGMSFQFVNAPVGAGPALDGGVQARVIDAVGNEATITLVPDFRVDLEPPQPLTDAEQALLTYERIPWGATRSGGLPRFSVEGRAGPWNADDVLVFYEGATAQSFVLGEARAQPGSALPRVEFSRADRQRIWVSRFDTACNAATADPQSLQNVVWLASPVASASSPRNPHVFSRAEVASTAPLAAQRTPVTAQSVVSSTARGGWRVALAGPTPATLTPRAGDSLLVGDPLRGRTVMLGGGPIGTREVWSSDGSTWSQLPVPATMPPPNYVGGLFEAHTGRIVFLAGSTTLETWYLDGDRFGEISTPALIANNLNPAWAYDPLRRRIVAFGGTRNGTTGYHNQTWVLDASGWRQLATSGTQPIAAAQRRLIFDAARQRMLLLADEYPARVGYVLEGDVWRQITAPANLTPFGLSGAKLAFDPSLNSVIVFGGGHCCASTSLTSRLVGDAWVNIPAPSTLLGRSYPRLAWDPERSRLVMCGGYDATSRTYQPDCWVLENQAWRPIEGPADTQMLISSWSMEFDPARRRMMIVGGYRADTWVLEGDGWVRTSSPDGFAARGGASLVSDPTHGRLLYVGGTVVPDGGTNTATADVWSMSTATTRLPDLPFGPRFQQSMVADAVNSRVMLIGGRNSVSSFTPVAMDTWLFDGQSWTSLPAPSGMVGRVMPSIAADPVTSQVVLFGGFSPVTAASEVWSFNAGVWSPYPNLPSPWSPQRRATVGFDRARQSFVSFVPFASAPLADGGTRSQSEAWSFDPSGFRAATPQSTRSNAAAAFDPASGRLLTFGGVNADAGVNAETWLLEDNQWTLAQPPVSPAPRTSAVLCAHPPSGQFVLIGGGATSTTFAEDSWVFGSDGWSRVELPESFGQRPALSCVFDEARGVLVAVSAAAADTCEFGLDPRSGPGLMVSVDLSTLLPAGATAQVLSATSRAAGDSVQVFDPLAGRGFLLPDGGAERLDGGLWSLSDGGTFRRFALPRPGAAMQVWDPSQSSFVTMASTTQRPDAGLSPLSFQVDAGVLLNGDGLYLQLTSFGGSDSTQPGGVRATVVAEPPEVEVRYSVR